MKFDKYEGAGNDFILIDDRDEAFPLKKEFIRQLCHRRFGVGADGVILLQKDVRADFRMRIFNSDGGEAEGCGNGVRCFMRFCSDLGLGRAARIALGDRVLSAKLCDQGVAVEMGEMREMRLHCPLFDWQMHLVDSGVPHAVAFVPDVEKISLEEVSPPIRNHVNANVNFATRQQDGLVRVRTYERGVEAETLACGTGACAVAVLGAELFGWESPVEIQTLGGRLQVHFDSKYRQVRLVGPAKKVFSGQFSSDFGFANLGAAG